MPRSKPNESQRLSRSAGVLARAVRWRIFTGLTVGRICAFCSDTLAIVARSDVSALKNGEVQKENQWFGHLRTQVKL